MAILPVLIKCSFIVVSVIEIMLALVPLNCQVTPSWQELLRITEYKKVSEKLQTDEFPLISNVVQFAGTLHDNSAQLSNGLE